MWLHVTAERKLNNSVNRDVCNAEVAGVAWQGKSGSLHVLKIAQSGGSVAKSQNTQFI